MSIGALALTVLLGACAALQPPRAESTNVYVLKADPLRKATTPPRDVVIEVAPPRAWPGFDTAHMIYVRSPYELESFATSRWADAPSRMLGPLLARALEQSGRFRAVVQMPSTVAADLRLDSEIVRLQQSFAIRPSQAEVTVRVQLTDIRGKRVVASRVFEEAETAPSEDAAGGVIAANVALQRMLERIADFCAEEAVSR